MEMVAVRGSRRDVAGLPLPELDPAREPLLLGAGGALPPDGESADPVARLTDAVAQAERLAAVTAAFRDELVASTYREGAAEYAARLTHMQPAERREWGARGMLAELACALRVPETTLSRRLARQTALAALPRFREANAAGLISSWHCDVMLDVFRGVDDEAALDAADAALLDKALGSTASEQRVAARRWRARHVPRTNDERRRNLADRRVEITPADDDLCWLSALLPAAQAVAIYHKLSDVAAAVQGPDEGRTLSQLRADALCDLLLEPQGAVGRPEDAVPGTAGGSDGAAAVDDHEPTGAGSAVGVAASDSSCDSADRPHWPHGLAGIKPVVVLTVPVLSLLGHSDEPAELEGFGPIDIETARRLAAQAPSFIRVLTDPESGAVLSVGRDRYRVPADLRTALAIRDETCRFPGCRRRAMRCDVDHARAWEHGGCTDIDNLEHLCRKHHRLKHELGWQAGHEGGGVLTWTSPVGRPYRSEPARRVESRRPPPQRSLSSGPEQPSVRTRRRGTGGPPGPVRSHRPDYPDEPPF